MTDAKAPTTGAPLEFGISTGDSSGKPVINFAPQAADLVPPADYPDRIEWVRQSYERFIEKVLEIETLRGASLAF